MFFVPLPNILRQGNLMKWFHRISSSYSSNHLIFPLSFIILRVLCDFHAKETLTHDNLKLSLLFLIRTSINHYSIIIIQTCFDKATTFVFQNELDLNLCKLRVVYVFWKCHKIFTAIYLHSANLPLEPYVPSLRLQLYKTVRFMFIKSMPVDRSAYIYLF